MRYAAIVTSAGSSTRFSTNGLTNSTGLQNSLQKKEFACPAFLGGKSVLESSCQAFIETEGLVCLVITYKKGTLEQTKVAVAEILKRFDKVLFVEGGQTRQESVHLALEALDNWAKSKDTSFELVAIHDGARPFTTSTLVKSCLESAASTGGAAPVLKETDTLVEVKDGLFQRKLDRDITFRIQTPQIFKFPEILLAHRFASEKSSRVYTDDSQLYMDFGLQVAAVEGDPKNKKITYPGDLA